MSIRTLNGVNAMAIPAKNLFIPGNLGNLQVKYKDHDFFVVDENHHEFAVERGDLSPELRGISQEHLSKCLRVDCLALSKIGEDYSIRLQHSLKGGGWISGWIAKQATRFTLVNLLIGVPTVLVGIVAFPAGAVVFVGATVGTALATGYKFGPTINLAEKTAERAFNASSLP